MIYSIIAFSALIVAIVSALFAIFSKHQYYWLSAFGMYVFSFLAGFSIGQLTVGLTFIPISMGLGYSFGWINSKIRVVIFLFIGVLIGCFMVFFVDDVWLFFPFWFLMG